MSTTWKIVIGLVVVVALIFGWRFMSKSNKSSVVATNSQSAETAIQPGQSATDQSTSVDQDSASIDAQMNVINSNSAEVDQSFNDKPVAQTE